MCEIISRPFGNSGVGRGGTWVNVPLEDEKNFDALNQPAICFLLLVLIYKHVQNNTTKKPTTLISKIKIFGGH